MKLLGFNITRAKEKTRISELRYKDRCQRGIPITRRSYDAAATSRHNENHWLYADSRDADSIIWADLPTLRNRARYEVRNNSYAKGIVDTKANDIVGTGPRLQIQTNNPKTDRKIEDRFNEWSQGCDLGGKLSFADIIRLAGSLQQDESGEAFIVLQNAKPKEKLSWTRAKPEVKLRLLVVEPDRVQTPLGLFGKSGFDDEKIRNGIEVDDFGRPLYYYILKKHPGSTYVVDIFGEYDKVPARNVIHLYRQDRPGQTRGVPWITPAIPLFAQLRRFTLATVTAAETAANISAVTETEMGGSEVDEIEAMDEIEIARNAMLTLPAGTKMNQFKPEQPPSTYDKFKAELLNEIGRCVNMPFNVAAGNSSNYNYASGRLDWQVYYRFIKTIRAWIELQVCNRIFYTWLREAVLVPGYLPIGRTNITPAWFWPGQEHVDPIKEAMAQEKRLKNLTSNLSIEYSNQGRDWEREIKQRVKEINLLKEIGILDDKDSKKEMEDIARAVRAGVPIAVSEARASLGLAEDAPEGKMLRFNDQDVLQYHIENGVLTVNEIRKVLGLGDVTWGDVPVRKKGVSLAGVNGDGEKEEEGETESEEN